MMDTVKSFLRGVMDVAMTVIPLSVVLGVIFGPLAYISGQKLGVIHFLSSYDVTMAVLAILWGLAMPTMYLINDKLNIDD